MTATNRNPRICDSFHQYYEDKKLWENLTWLGIPMWKLPFDAMVVQSLICEIKPDYIIETGTGMGGSSAFYASVLESLGGGHVITVDIDKKHLLDKIPEHIRNRITFIHSSSVEVSTVVQIYNKCHFKKNLVILDSWHTCDHVLKELQAYSDLVQIGSYMIVEDSHVSGHPVEWKWGDGPHEAIHKFLSTIKGIGFKIDPFCEHQEMTFNPDGYLKRIK